MPNEETPIAIELAKKQREISVAEFFERNRHLLGFDNKKKALLTVVKEAVDNSLTYDMPLVIRKNGKISLTKIGKLIDEAIESRKKDVSLMRNGSLEKLQLEENVEALSFDKETLKLDFRKVSSFFRHKVNSKIYRVRLTSGRYVDLTAYHSLFTLDKGKIVSIPTSELKTGMPVIVPRKSWSNALVSGELNLIDGLLSLNPSITSKVNVYGINRVLTDTVIQEVRDLLPKSKQYRINDFRRFNYIPFNILRKLHLDINKLSGSKLGESLSRNKIPAVIKLDHDFAELLGLYVAEGSMLKSQTRLHFSFGGHEKGLIYYLADLFEKIFGFPPKIKKAHESAYNVIANSTILCMVFKHLLKVGDSARTKRIPEIVFDFNHNLKHSFILAYLAGDGHPTDEMFNLLKNDRYIKEAKCEKVTCATASFGLFTDLQYLLSSLGINYSVGFKKPENRLINFTLS